MAGRLGGVVVMKDKAPEQPGSSKREPGPQGTTEQRPRPETPMHMEINSRKARGRLSREDQRRLGDILQKVYDDVLQQGVPDRFKDLIQRIDQNGPAEEDEGRPAERSAASPSAESEHVMQAQSSNKPKEQH